jgi:Cu-Zn family superoxide dismutase
MRSIRVVAAGAALAAVALLVGFGASLATGGDDRSASRAIAVLKDAVGQQVGLAVLRQRHGEVSVNVDAWSLTPGFHGFHAHAVGQCVPPFTSAGGHFNPAGAGHGDHAGDLPTLLVNDDGTAELRFTTDRFSLGDLSDPDGSALIVHANRDNYANIPDRYHSHPKDTFGPDVDTLATGDAGARAACGVVRERGAGR